MKIIVLGAGGLAGSAFMRVLPSLGHDCIPVTRTNYAESIGLSADVLINADGNSAKYMADRDPVGEIERSVNSVMRACIDFHAATHVLLSSADVYPNQSDPSANSEESSIHPSQLSVYGLCKYMAECVVMNRCPRRIIIRLGGLLGPGLRKNPVFDLLTGQPLRVHPDSEFGYIHTDEVVKIVTELLHRDRANEIFNVCGEGMVSIRQIMEWTGRSNTVPDKTTKPLHYEINNRRLASFWKIPSSAETAKEFISWRKNQNQKP